MESILELLLGFAVGWILLRVAMNWAGNYAQNKLERLDREIAEIKQVYKLVKVEEYQGIFYLFDTENDQFLGQGRTAQEFAEHIRKDLVIQIVEGDADVVARFCASIPKLDEQTA
jgi:hypothetical protein